MSFLLLFLLTLMDILETEKPKIDLHYSLCYPPSLLDSPEPWLSRLSSTASLDQPHVASFYEEKDLGV